MVEGDRDSLHSVYSAYAAIPRRETSNGPDIRERSARRSDL